MSLFFKTILIEDEKLARQRLRRLLAPYSDFIDVIDEAENGVEGVEKINKYKPDLIFLDIQMPGLTGFEMLKKLDHMPAVVFTTAYEEYAIKAFEQNSIDYLLKPIEQERLEITVQKLKRLKRTDQNIDAARLMELIDSMKPQKEITSIPVKIGDKILLIKLSDIIYLEAKEKNVFINDAEGKEHLIDFTITELSTKLPKQFMQVHRAFIINKEKIKEIKKYGDGKYTVVMNNKTNSQIMTGSSYTQEVRGIFEL